LLPIGGDQKTIVQILAATALDMSVASF